MDSDMLEVFQEQVKVTRSNALARSKHQLGLLQNRLMYLLFSRIQRNDEHLLTQRIPIVDIRERFNVNRGSFYAELREAATDLVRQPLSLEREHGGWKVLSWVTSAEYVPASQSLDGNGYLEIKLHEDLAPHLLHLKERYNSIPLDALLALSSSHSQRLVDILWHDSFAGQRAKLSYDIEDLKSRMSLEGKYARFRDFCRVLDLAREEFERKIPLRFSYRGSKVGRSWQQIHFDVWAVTEKDKVLDGELLNDRERSLLERLRRAGYTQDLHGLIQQYPAEEIERVLSLAYAAQQRAVHTHKPIRNLGGLIHSMLQSGAGKVTKEPEKASELRVEADAETLYDAWLAARMAYAGKVWLKLPEGDRPFVLDYLRMHTKPFLLSQLEKQGWQGPLFEKRRADCLVELKLLAFPESLRTLDSFVRSMDSWMAMPPEQQAKLLQAVLALEG